jgi:hypothetical protein
MANLIICVKSCLRDMRLGFHQAIRETWGKDFHGFADMRFFVGVSERPLDTTHVSYLKDEIGLDSKDGYMDLPEKTNRICRWLQSKVFEHAFFCDNDTFVRADRLLSLPYKKLDYAGYFCTGPSEVLSRFDYRDHMGVYPQSYPWCSGGAGYFLSSRAVHDIANELPKVWAEDMYVGQVLGPKVHAGVYQAAYLQDLNFNATQHFKKSKMYPQFTPEILRRIYAEGGPERLYAEAKEK